MPTFATPDPIAVSVELSVGDVRVVASDRTDTVVQVRPTDASRELDVRDAEQTRVEHTASGLLVKTPRPRGLGLLGKPGSVDVTIELPAGSSLDGDSSVAAFHSAGRLGECRIKTTAGNVDLDETGPLDLHTGAGAVSVAKVVGNAEVTTGTGRIRLGQIDGSAVIKNSNGDTRIGDVTGDLRVNAANGTIAVDRVEAGVEAKTANGDVRLGELARGTAVVNTAYGRVDVGIRQGVPAWLDLVTSYGNVQNDLNADEGPASGEDAVKVRARTAFGDITVHRS